MTTLFSWMLTSPVGQVRLILAEDVVIEIARDWDQDWLVRVADVLPDEKRAQRAALTRTANLEQAARYKLEGSVDRVTTHILSGVLYMENSGSNLHRKPGPLLWSLFAQDWEELS